MVFTVALLIALTHSGPRGLLSASQGIPPTHCCSWGGMEGQRGSVPQGTGVCQDQCPRTQYQAPMCTHGTEKASGMAGPSSGHSLSSSYLSPLCLDSPHGLLSVTHSTKCLSVACQGPGTGLSVFSLLTHFILTGTPPNREASRGSQSQTIHQSHTAHAWMRPRLLTDLLQSSQHSLSSSDLPLLSPHTTHPETSLSLQNIQLSTTHAPIFFLMFFPLTTQASAQTTLSPGPCLLFTIASA